jgi:YidC/Oxa1 family membrane protein insertase
LNWLYTAVTWIMLRWHDAFSFLESRTFLGTNWDWILAIIFLVITVRIVLFPLFVKQIKSQRAMQAIQPQLKELQQKHKGDRETLQKEMMELYKREKANPLMGCLPIFLQIPVFISLFWILGRRMDPNRPRIVKAIGGDPPDPAVLEASNIEIYTWTFAQYESAANAKLFNAPIAATMFEMGWFGERNMTALYPEMGTSALNVGIVAGVLTVIMVITTFLTTRQMILKTGWATDPQQLMVQRLMVYGLPLMLLFSGAFFPVAVIIYWVINNLFSLGQQQWVLRKYPPPPTAGALGGAPRPAGQPGERRGGKDRKDGKDGKDGKDAERPAIDGRKLAPKPGAKPIKNVPPKRTPAKNIPPKRKNSAQRKG